MYAIRSYYASPIRAAPQDEGLRHHIPEGGGDIPLALLGIGGDTVANQLVRSRPGDTLDTVREGHMLQYRGVSHRQNAADEMAHVFPGDVLAQIIDRGGRVA